jgi:hypothetical protein
MYYPAITTAALFTAIILNDTIQRNTSETPQHFILGLISVLIMLVLSQKGAELVAWGLLFIPAVIIILSLFIGNVGTGTTTSTGTTNTTPSPTVTPGQTVQTPCGTVAPPPPSSSTNVQPNPAACTGSPAPAPSCPQPPPTPSPKSQPIPPINIAPNARITPVTTCPEPK